MAETGPVPGRGRALRADARRNLAKILEVAQDAFAGEGLSVSLDEIARRAGVGPGTVHRHFPTKDALIEAVIVGRLTAMTSRANALADAADPTGAFYGFFADLAGDAAHNLALASAVSQPGQLSNSIESAGADLRAAFAALLRRAQSAGGVRADVSADELHAIVTGLLAAERALPPDSRGRGLSIIIDGLRPRP